jgi:hypothetical protein
MVENNFGNMGLQATLFGRSTSPGMTRIDLGPGGQGCHTVWTNEEVRIPSVVSQLSLATGLIYTYAKPVGPDRTDPWYFTAVDFETGKTVFQRLAGTGVLYNNNYSGVYLGPDGAAYVGVLGGLVRITDTGRGGGDDDEDRDRRE